MGTNKFDFLSRHNTECKKSFLMHCQLIIASPRAVESRNNIFLCKQGTQNGKFACTGNLTVRIHDYATSVHASRSSRAARITAQQRCSLVWQKAIGRFACSINALKPLRGSIVFARCFETLKKGLWKLEGALVEATKREVLHWAVGEQGSKQG
jgi:hypothetical protein